MAKDEIKKLGPNSTKQHQTTQNSTEDFGGLKGSIRTNFNTEDTERTEGHGAESVLKSQKIRVLIGVNRRE